MKDNLKCSFIIPGYKCDEYIFRNIEAIIDQDYKNYEIIPVLNGNWEGKEGLIQKLRDQYGDKINLISIDTPGLGNANNEGLKYATGDIISHLSSDLYLLPGTLRTWIETFQDNPKYGLVYSGYRLVSRAPMDVYPSNPYDRYWLECEPFIDGANPYRREFAVEWDTGLKSLIDWDWSLSITKKTDGYYIKEPLYYAEPPKEGGLSIDSNKNWVYRRRQIQSKHGIPDRKICVCSLIDQQYALELAKLTNFDFRSYPGYKPHDYNLIYQYGFPADLDNIQMAVGVFFQHWKHKVIHWIGQDLLLLIQNKWTDVDYFCQLGLSKVKNHFCITQKDYQLLNRLHIDSEIVYPPIQIDETNGTLNTISVNDDELIFQLAKGMPDIEFKKNDLNCKITVHFQDSISNIFKSICKGNLVITEKNLPSTYNITAFTNVPELRKMLIHTIRKIKSVDAHPDPKDIEFYKSRLNPGYFKNKLEKLSEKPISKYARLEDIQDKMQGVWNTDKVVN